MNKVDVSKKTTPIGSVSAQGYIIRKATIYIDSTEDIENPQSDVEIRIVADLLWVYIPERDSSRNDVVLTLDIDKEQFLMQGKAIEIINGKEIFGKIMRVLVGSMKLN